MNFAVSPHQSLNEGRPEACLDAAEANPSRGPAVAGLEHARFSGRPIESVGRAVTGMIDPGSAARSNRARSRRGLPPTSGGIPRAPTGFGARHNKGSAHIRRGARVCRRSARTRPCVASGPTRLACRDRPAPRPTRTRSSAHPDRAPQIRSSGSAASVETIGVHRHDDIGVLSVVGEIDCRALRRLGPASLTGIIDPASAAIRYSAGKANTSVSSRPTHFPPLPFRRRLAIQPPTAPCLD